MSVCHTQTGTQQQKNIRFRSFCDQVEEVLRTGELPDKNNTAFRICGRGDGYWRIQEDRRVGREGSIQIFRKNECCSSCFGYLNKAAMLTKNYRRHHTTLHTRIANSTMREASQLIDVFANMLLNDDFENVEYSIINRIVSHDGSVHTETFSTSNLTNASNSTNASLAQGLVEEEEEIVHESYDEDFPNEYLCPINLTPMKEPVICMDGHSYEKKAIERWFRSNNKSPKTGLVLESKMLIPNHALRSAIEEYKSKKVSSKSSTE
jgi:hypothetical protein